MKDKAENMPEEIFDWLAEKDFKELSESERSIVLKHMTEDEYREMHKSSLLAESLSGNSRKRIKENVLRAFDDVHKPKYILSKNTAWKAAAMLFFVCSLSLLSFLIKKQKDDSAFAAVLRDTVYVTRQVELAADRVSDTVYLYASNETPAQRLKPNRTRKTNRYYGRPSQAAEDLNTFDYRETKGELRRNSIKDDSLLKKFPSVSVL